MSRRVDTEGDAVAPPDISPPPFTSPLLLEIPLWKFGRIKFESSSNKASLAVLALVLIIAAFIILGIIEALPGSHEGVSGVMGVLGQALLLVLGVLLGVTEAKRGDS